MLPTGYILFSVAAEMLFIVEARLATFRVVGMVAPLPCAAVYAAETALLILSISDVMSMLRTSYRRKRVRDVVGKRHLARAVMIAFRYRVARHCQAVDAAGHSAVIRH